MIVTPSTISSIADMEARVQRDYLAEVKRDVRYARESRQRRLEAIVEGRRDALLLVGAGFEVSTSEYTPFADVIVHIGDASEGRKGSPQRRAAARSVKDKKVLIAKLFRSRLEEYSKSLVDGQEKKGKIEVTLRVAKNPRVLVRYTDVIALDSEANERQRCKVVKRIVKQAPRVVEYSLECQR